MGTRGEIGVETEEARAPGIGLGGWWSEGRAGWMDVWTGAGGVGAGWRCKEGLGRPALLLVVEGGMTTGTGAGIAVVVGGGGATANVGVGVGGWERGCGGGCDSRRVVTLRGTETVIVGGVTTVLAPGGVEVGAICGW